MALINTDDIKSKHYYRFVFQILFILFGLGISFGSYLITLKFHHDEINKYLQTEFETVNESKCTIIKRYFNTNKELLFAINGSNIFKEYLQNTQNETLKKMASDLFLAQAGSYSKIMQLRYIDADGKEVIRVDRNHLGDKAVVVEEDKLQNKKERYYFQEASKEKDGEIWTSKLDLNIEHGKIEKPLKPVLRLATPVYFQGRFRGIVIVNSFAESFLNELSFSSAFDISLIDKEGEFLIDNLSGEDNSWSRYLDNKSSFKEVEPEFADEILSKADFKSGYIFSHKLKVEKDSDGLRIILKAKESFLKSLKDEEDTLVKTNFLLVFLLSIPVGFIFALIPTRLNDKILEITKEQTRDLEIIDKYTLMTDGDLEGNITYVSSHFLELTGYTKEELIGQNHKIMSSHLTDRKTFKDMWMTISMGENWQGEISNLDKSGKELWFDTIIVPKRDLKGKIIGYSANRIDITDKKIIEKLSITDELSDLYNRRYFNMIIEQEIERARRDGKPLALMIMDIDFFKKYNDYYGHSKGDDVIKSVAAAIRNSLKRDSDFAFRVGGEEFAVILSGVDREGSIEVAEGIVNSVRDLKIPHEKSDAHEFVTISLGVFIGEGDLNVDDIYEKADQELYKAKEGGRNRFSIG